MYMLGVNTKILAVKPIITALLIFSSWLTVPTPCQAAGETAFPILRELTEPRVLGLGGATISDTAWSGGAPVNPASVTGARRSGAICYGRQMLDIWSGQVSAAFPVRSFTVGGWISTFDYGSFDETASGLGKVGTFSAAEHIVGGFLAGKLGDALKWGGSMKLAWGTIKDANASAGAVDLGMVWDTGWNRLRLGAAVRNWGKQWNSYGRDRFPLPSEALIGGSRELRYLPLTLNAVLALSRRSEGTWNADFLPGKLGVFVSGGGELRIATNAGNQLAALRIGYRSLREGLRVGNSDDMLAGLSFGVGIPFRSFRFDYAFAAMGTLGNLHRFGFMGWF